MAKGDALKKRYKIIDEETGEEVQGWVMRPSEDHFARTAMSVYSGLCGVRDDSVTLFSRQDPPLPDEAEWDLIEDVIEEAKPREATLSDMLSADQLETLSLASDGDGSVKSMELFLKTMGLTPVALVCSTNEQDEEAIRRAKKEHQALALIHNYQARLVGTGFESGT